MTCADHARRVVKEEQDKNVDYHLFGWTNHYSPRYGRCYLKLSLFRNSKADKTMPLMYDSLIDVMENREVAASTSDRSDLAQALCGFDDGEAKKSGDCLAAMRFIGERMQN